MCPHLADSVDTSGSTVRRLRHSGAMALRPMDDLETPGFACSHCLVWALAWGSGLTWKNQWIPHLNKDPPSTGIDRSSRSQLVATPQIHPIP